MDLEAVNREVKREFEEEWAGTSVENLLITNQYPRAKEEFACFEKFLPKDDLILEAGCGLGPKLIYFTQNTTQWWGLITSFLLLSEFIDTIPL